MIKETPMGKEIKSCYVFHNNPPNKYIRSRY